jgi:pyruvate formate lyase activating enzyme
VDICPAMARDMVGRYLSVPELIDIIKKDILFYDSSNGGVTISGGEPLMQWESLLDLLRECKRLGIHTALDTSGFTSWDILEEIAEVVDLFLYDIKVMDDRKHHFYTGVSNKIILSNLENLSRIDKKTVIRIPLIPGINDDNENLKKTGSFIAQLHNVQQVDILPYHNLQTSKYKKLNIPYRAKNFTAPTIEQLFIITTILKKYGLNVNH